MHDFLPLRENKIVLFEVFAQQLQRSLTVLHNNFTVFVVDRGLEEVPPPATLLEELEEQLRVVASTNEASIVLEEATLEVKLNLIAFVDRFIKTCEHLFLRVTDESFSAQVTALG